MTSRSHGPFALRDSLPASDDPGTDGSECPGSAERSTTSPTDQAFVLGDERKRIRQRWKIAFSFSEGLDAQRLSHSAARWQSPNTRDGATIGPQRLLAIASRSFTTGGRTSAHIDASVGRERPAVRSHRERRMP
jgi:hypothetical protein